jgi:hypothetical protein
VDEFQAAIFRSNMSDAHAEFQCAALKAYEQVPAGIRMKRLTKTHLQSFFADFCTAPRQRDIPFSEPNGKINGEARNSIFKSLHN